MNVYLAAIVMATLIVACTAQTSVGTAARAFVAGYCSVPVYSRVALRELVAASVQPNRIEVQCAGDPPAISREG